MCDIGENNMLSIQFCDNHYKKICEKFNNYSLFTFFMVFPDFL